MKALLSNQFVQYLIMFMMFFVVSVCIFTPEFQLAQRGAEFSVHFMLAFVLLTLLFTIFDQKRLVLVSAACCAGLAIFLKQASNSSLKFPERTDHPEISIAHVNVANVQTSHQSLAQLLIDESPDVISFQEITPDWDYILSDLLQNEYPYKHAMVRIDYYGMSVFSKMPLSFADTLNFQDVPNLKVNLAFDDQQIALMSSYMLPPLYNQLDEKRRAHFAFLADEVNQSETPVVSLGDFNITYWSSELRNYKNAASLENSRRDISASGLRIPHDHIFYTNDMECTSFSEIIDSELRHLGIMGHFQFKPQIPQRPAFTNKVNLF